MARLGAAHLKRRNVVASGLPWPHGCAIRTVCHEARRDVLEHRLAPRCSIHCCAAAVDMNGRRGPGPVTVIPPEIKAARQQASEAVPSEGGLLRAKRPLPRRNHRRCAAVLTEGQRLWMVVEEDVYVLLVDPLEEAVQVGEQCFVLLVEALQRTGGGGAAIEPPVAVQRRDVEAEVVVNEALDFSPLLALAVPAPYNTYA